MSGARQSRRRRREHRGAKGAEWGVIWGGLSAPQPTRRSGERCELPKRGPEPRPLSHFLHILGHRTLLVARKIRFSSLKYREKVVVTVTTTFKSAGDKSPSSHTKLRLCVYYCFIVINSGREHYVMDASASSDNSMRSSLHDYSSVVRESLLPC